MARPRVLLATLVVGAGAACGINVTGVEPVTDVDAGVDAASPRVPLDATTSTDARTDATVDADADIVDAGLVTLTVDPGDAGAGIVSEPSGIECPKVTCELAVAAGTPVTLSANLGTDLSVTGWSEPTCGREPTCVVTPTESRTVSMTVARHVHYMHSPTTLYRVRLPDGANQDPKAFVNCGGGNVQDMAIDRTGKAFVVSTTTLYELDLATATCTEKGNTNAGLNALSFAPDPLDITKDALFGAAVGSSTLYRLNTATGQAATFMDMGAGNVPSGDIAYVPGQGLFASLAPNGSANDRLARIDLNERTVTVIGQLPASAIYALGWFGTSLIAYGNGKSFLINPANAASADLNTATGIEAYGAASGP